jgi:hypothetical protein
MIYTKKKREKHRRNETTQKWNSNIKKRKRKSGNHLGNDRNEEIGVKVE